MHEGRLKPAFVVYGHGYYAYQLVGGLCNPVMLYTAPLSIWSVLQSMSIESSRYWSNLVHQLEPYVPGEQPRVEGLVKLNTNENPYPPSPRVMELIGEPQLQDLRLYPDPSSGSLKEAIASHFGLMEDQVVVGNGSDEILAFAFQAFFKQDKPILFPDITYGFYPVYGKLFELDYREIPLAEDFSINLMDYRQDNGGIIFPNPNAPTGIAMGLEAIESLLQANTESVVIVDEAYVDFGAESASALVDRYPNLLVVQTFSKSRFSCQISVAMFSFSLIKSLILRSVYKQ